MGGSGVRNLKSMEKFEITVLEGGRELEALRPQVGLKTLDFHGTYL